MRNKLAENWIFSTIFLEVWTVSRVQLKINSTRRIIISLIFISSTLSGGTAPLISKRNRNYHLKQPRLKLKVFHSPAAPEPTRCHPTLCLYSMSELEASTCASIFHFQLSSVLFSNSKVANFCSTTLIDDWKSFPPVTFFLKNLPKFFSRFCVKNYYEKLLKLLFFFIFPVVVSFCTAESGVGGNSRLEMEKVLLCYKCVFSCELRKERMVLCDKLHERGKTLAAVARKRRRDDENYNMNLLTNMLSFQFFSKHTTLNTADDVITEKLEKFRFFPARPEWGGFQCFVLMLRKKFAFVLMGQSDFFFRKEHNLNYSSQTLPPTKAERL